MEQWQQEKAEQMKEKISKLLENLTCDELVIASNMLQCRFVDKKNYI